MIILVMSQLFRNEIYALWAILAGVVIGIGIVESALSIGVLFVAVVLQAHLKYHNLPPLQQWHH